MMLYCMKVYNLYILFLKHVYLKVFQASVYYKWLLILLHNTL